MASSKDVAKLAGVSVATVSRVYSGHANIVTPRTFQKVMEAGTLLGYAPDQIARSLKSRHSNTIGLLIPNSSNPFFLQVMNILSSDLKQFGFNLIVSFCHEDRTDEYQNILNMLSARVAAILFTPVCHNRNVLKQLRKNHIYAMQLNRKMYDELDAVLWDDEDGVHEAASYLLDCGFCKPMLLGPVASRRSGFQLALVERGLAPAVSQIIQTNDTVGVDKDLLLNGIKNYRPDALISVAHETSYCVLNILKELNYAYPKDVSLICYDDDELTRFLEITVVAHDLETQGHITCDILIDAMSREPFSHDPTTKLLKTKLIERKSVKKA